jgi:hypothetical protein
MVSCEAGPAYLCECVGNCADDAGEVTGTSGQARVDSGILVL